MFNLIYFKYNYIFHIKFVFLYINKNKHVSNTLYYIIIFFPNQFILIPSIYDKTKYYIIFHFFII